MPRVDHDLVLNLARIGVRWYRDLDAHKLARDGAVAGFRATTNRGEQES